MHSIILICRTFLTIFVAQLEGSMVQAIVEKVRNCFYSNNETPIQPMLGNSNSSWFKLYFIYPKWEVKKYFRINSLKLRITIRKYVLVRLETNAPPVQIFNLFSKSCIFRMSCNLCFISLNGFLSLCQLHS